MRADSAILQRLIHMTYWLAPLILRLGTNPHLAHPGDIVFRHACAMGLEGIVSKRLGALHFRALEGLAQLQESERAGREAGGPPNERTLAEGGVHAAPGGN